MTTESPLVVVVDDDDAICRALARSLTLQGYRVRTYCSPQAYLDESDVLDPKCMLLDIRMPDMDGVALLRLVRRSGIEVPIVFMTAADDITTVVTAMKAGALDLLAKPFTPEALGQAVARAIASDAAAERNRRALEEIWRAASDLTPREAEVCGLVACGLPNKRVAALIGTREKTVKVHRGRVMQKLHMNSFAELVRFVETLRREASYKSLRIGARETARPKAVNIIIDFTKREREATAVGIGLPSADHWEMPVG